MQTVPKIKNIAILGAGVVGLSTADRLLELKVNANITILTDKFLTETTSDGAGGLFRPDDRFIPGVPKPLVK
jgi:glycine/D-amino acid oxidase-like deaminating enzyme